MLCTPPPSRFLQGACGPPATPPPPSETAKIQNHWSPPLICPLFFCPACETNFHTLFNLIPPSWSSRQLFSTISDHSQSKTTIFSTLVKPPPTPPKILLLHQSCPSLVFSPTPHHYPIPCLSVPALLVAFSPSLSAVPFMLHPDPFCVLALPLALTMYSRNKMIKDGDIIIRIRKAFHALAVAAYVPGLVCEPGLLRLASAGALALFVLLECCRALNIPPLARSLEAGLRPFVDSRDAGRLILTHIYLLLGLSAPIWLAARQSDTGDSSLAPYAGVLSVGLGDAVAALAGSSLGRIHWPGTSKTLEGTTFSLLTQLALALVILGPKLDVVLPLAASLGLVCLLEAFTEQIDNMLLPLYLFALFTV
uniref:dolichol kinase n=1 Tax=Eptatretus burgeri TaxID=7764 RepID=A0A8C4R0V5_EPTBU